MEYKYTIIGIPRTKKNSSRIVKRGKRKYIIPSPAFEKYQRTAKLIGDKPKNPIDYPVNLKAIYYRERNIGDLVNFIQGTCDLLELWDVVKNDKWIMGLDGCRLSKDAKDPRVEIILTQL